MVFNRNGVIHVLTLLLFFQMKKREKLFTFFGMIPPADPLDLRNIGKPFAEVSSYAIHADLISPTFI